MTRQVTITYNTASAVSRAIEALENRYNAILYTPGPDANFSRQLIRNDIHLLRQIIRDWNHTDTYTTQV